MDGKTASENTGGNVGGQPEAWRSRQQRVLTELREASGKKREDIAHDANLSYWRYLRFEEGKSSLPAEHLPGLADALMVDRTTLLQKLGIVAEPSLRDLLEALGMPEDEMRQLLSSMAGQPTTPDQRQAIARFVADVLSKRVQAGEKRRRA